MSWFSCVRLSHPFEMHKLIVTGHALPGPYVRLWYLLNVHETFVTWHAVGLCAMLCSHLLNMYETCVTGHAMGNKTKTVSIFSANNEKISKSSTQAPVVLFTSITYHYWIILRCGKNSNPTTINKTSISLPFYNILFKDDSHVVGEVRTGTVRV